MLVSAVMPTRGRRQFAAQALRSFLSQTWPEMELVILDDADDPSFEVPPPFDNVKYVVLENRLTIPQKRNMVCEIAVGNIIVNFDSDDWSAPTRVERQMAMMEAEKKAVCGFRQMYFWDITKRQAWLYRGAHNYVLGTSLMFKREWWEKHIWNLKFKIASDNIFTSEAARSKQLIVSSVTDQMVARCHPGNTSPKRFGIAWKKTERENIPNEFFTSTMSNDGITRD